MLHDASTEPFDTTAINETLACISLLVDVESLWHLRLAILFQMLKMIGDNCV
ncbi:hypothetical protein [Clostridium sp.]|uniref:hypothetical protein n=1 Tax=Clostridium sp. TaxID=1506 RepID=UPI002FC97A81